MNFFTTLSEKLGFKPKENDEEREEDELEDDVVKKFMNAFPP